MVRPGVTPPPRQASVRASGYGASDDDYTTFQPQLTNGKSSNGTIGSEKLVKKKTSPKAATSVRASGYGASDDDYVTFQPQMTSGSSFAGTNGSEKLVKNKSSPMAVANLVMATFKFNSVPSGEDNSLHRNTTGSSMSSSRSNLSKHESSGALITKLSSGRFVTRQSTTSKQGLVPIETLRMEATSAGFPRFQLADFGVEWCRDITSLLTNSMRREVVDLYTILQSLHERKESLREGDVKSFFVWFETFVLYIQFAMEVVEENIIPWAERMEELPENEFLESNGGRMKVGKDIVSILQRILKHRKDFEAMKVASAYLKIKKVLLKWAPLLHGYLDALDLEIPPLIESHCSQEECQNMMGWIARRALDSNDKRCNIVLLVRFLEQRPRTLAYWKSTHLDPLEQSAHPQHWKAMSKLHFEGAGYFARTLAKVTEDKKNARIRR